VALLFAISVPVYTRLNGDASGEVSTPILSAARTGTKIRRDNFRVERRGPGRVIILWSAGTWLPDQERAFFPAESEPKAEPRLR